MNCKMCNMGQKKITKKMNGPMQFSVRSAFKFEICIS